MKRDEFKQMEDFRLVSHFASWLSKVSGRPVREESFEADLIDGVALCKVMVKLEGSGLVKFHDIPAGSTMPLGSFMARENIQAFSTAAKRLNLPVTFGTEELEKGNLKKIVSTLVFLAHTAHAQNVTVDEMDAEILEKVEEMDAALNSSQEESKDDSEGLSWFQALLIKLGLADWLNFLSIDAIKAYVATLRANVEARVLQRTASWKESLPESIKARITN
jgi:hypothetical protein